MSLMSVTVMAGWMALQMRVPHRVSRLAKFSSPSFHTEAGAERNMEMANFNLLSVATDWALQLLQ